MSTKKILLLPVAYIVMIFLITLNSNQNAFEAGIYQKKFVSIFYDNDFNIIDNSHKPWNTLITATDNVGDMHDFGAPIIWATILKTYDFFSLFNKLKVSIDNLYISPFTAFIIAFHTFLLIFIRRWESDKVGEWLFWSITISMGFLDYLIDNVFNADILSLFLMSYMIQQIINLKKIEGQISLPYKLGLLFGVLRAVKITSVLYLPAFLIYFYLISPNKKECFSFLFRFLIGFFIVLSFILINNFTILGDWSFLQGYNYSYSWAHPLNLSGWKATFIYPRSIFLHSFPLLLFVLIFTFRLYLLSKVRKATALDWFYIFAGLSIIFKLSLGIFGAADHFLGVGARQFFMDIPIILFFVNVSFKRYPRFTKIFVGIGLFMALYFFCEWYLYQKDSEVFSIAPLLAPQKVLSLAISFFPFFMGKLLALPGIIIQTPSYIFLFLFFTSLYLIVELFPISRGKLPYFLAMAFIYASLNNLIYNDKNTQNYFEGQSYSNKVMGASGKLYLYHELNSGFALGREYEAKYGDKSSQTYIAKVHKAHLKEVRKDIIFVGSEIEAKEIQSGYLDHAFPFNEPLLDTQKD